MLNLRRFFLLKTQSADSQSHTNSLKTRIFARKKLFMENIVAI